MTHLCVVLVCLSVPPPDTPVGSMAVKSSEFYKQDCPATREVDLPVTSDVAGAAMKSEWVSVGNRRMHAHGTLTGKHRSL